MLVDASRIRQIDARMGRKVFAGSGMLVSRSGQSGREIGDMRCGLICPMGLCLVGCGESNWLA
jgi:hypothetical protein